VGVIPATAYGFSFPPGVGASMGPGVLGTAIGVAGNGGFEGTTKLMAKCVAGIAVFSMDSVDALNIRSYLNDTLWFGGFSFFIYLRVGIRGRTKKKR